MGGQYVLDPVKNRKIRENSLKKHYIKWNLVAEDSEVWAKLQKKDCQNP